MHSTAFIASFQHNSRSCLMREFQDRRRTKKFLHSRYALAVLIVVLLLLSRGVWGIYAKYEKSQALVEKSKADLAILQSRQDTLTKSIEALNTEEGREKELRDRFGVVRQGEKMIILVDDTAPVRPSVNAINDSWWQKFLESLGL